MKQVTGAFRSGRLARWPRAGTDSLSAWRLVLPLLSVAFIATAPKAFPQAFDVTIQPPGVQESPLATNPTDYGATGVAVETFNEQPAGTISSKGFAFAGDPVVGMYLAAGGGLIVKADQFGGAGGTGNYLTENGSLAPNHGGTISTTIMFVNPERYFGMWWSAGDPFNVLEFLSGGKVIQTFTTSDVVNFINDSPDKNSYLGNPNKQFLHQDSSEDFAYLNFFAKKDLSFNEVVLSNNGSTGFESDNHTVATDYQDITGEPIPPTGPPFQTVDPGPITVIPPGPPILLPPGEIPPGGDLEVDPGGDVEIPGPDVDMPGGTIDDGGMIIVMDPIKIDPGSTVDIMCDGPLCQDSGKILVDGHATLSGTLNLVSDNGFHPAAGDHYTILVATGGISGTFSTINDFINNSGLTRVNIYAPNGFAVAYLPPGQNGDPSYTVHSQVPIPLNNICDIDSVLISALDPNVSQLGAPFDVWFSLAQQNRFNLEARLDQLMAGSTGFVSNIPEQTKETGKEIVPGKDGKEIQQPSPLQPAPENRWGVWVTGYGDWTNVYGEGAAQGYHYTTGGFTAGVDYRVLDHFVIGLMGGYAHDDVDLKPGDIGIDTGWGGAYAAYWSHGFYVLAAAFGGGNSLDTSRATILGGRADGSTNSQEWSTFGSTGYDFHLGNFVIGPTAALQYSYVSLDSYTEHGFAPLAVSGTSQESLRSDLGFRAWYVFPIGHASVRPFLRAAWDHEYKEGAIPVTAQLVDFPGTVTVPGVPLGHDSCIVNAGVSAQITERVSIYAEYDGQLGRSQYNSNGVSGGFSIAF
jgi:outer membrane autotransporter protein